MIVSATVLLPTLLTTLVVTEALQVYDCEGVNTTYEVVDMLQTEDCPPQTGLYMPAKMAYVQVLQVEPSTRIWGLLCQMHVSRFVVTCEKVLHAIDGPMWTVWRKSRVMSAKACLQARKNHYVVVGPKKEKLHFDLGITASGGYFTNGGTDGEGWLNCKSFRSAWLNVKYGYEQTMVELTVRYVYGAYDRKKDTVEFEGVAEIASRGSLADSMVGRVVWDTTEPANCADAASEVFKGSADRFALTADPESLPGSLILVNKYKTDQYAGFHLRGPRDLCGHQCYTCLLYTSPSPRDLSTSRMPSSA